MSDVRYGIIGCGMMGQEHVQNIALLPEARVTAVMEPDAGMRDKTRSLVPDVAFCDSVSDLVSRADVDCLVIASPNHLHAAQLTEVAAMRTLPILVEKPLFTDPADADALRALRSAYRAPIWVAMEYRYMPPIAAFLQEVEATTGGIKMLTIREHRFPFLEKVGDWNRFNRNTGGTFVEKCCHFFDLMRLAVGAEPLRIMATAGQDANHLDESYAGETPDILDNGYVIVDFANGVRAMLELCMFAEGALYQEEVSAVGPKGKIEAFVPGPRRFDACEAEPKLVISPRHPKAPVERAIPVDPGLLAAGDHNGSTFYQHQKFLELVRGTRTKPDVDLYDGWAAVRMGQAAQASAASGQAVTF